MRTVLTLDSFSTFILDLLSRRGLTTEITNDKQYAIIDYIAHLVAEDYTQIPKDLVSLGFIPRGKELAVEDYTQIPKDLVSLGFIP